MIYSFDSFLQLTHCNAQDYNYNQINQAKFKQGVLLSFSFSHFISYLFKNFEILILATKVSKGPTIHPHQSFY